MNVALIEFGNSHDECLYTQVVYLSKAGHKVFLCCSNELFERVKHFDGIEQFICKDFSSFKLFSYWRFVCQLKSFGINYILFNSASGKEVEKFLLFSRFYKFSYAGLLHNADKLYNSFTQRIISSKIKKYFVLNDYVSLSHNKVQFCTFYPILFPPFEQEPIYKPENEIWLCIPGQAEFKWRDYKSLFNALARYPLPANIKLIFLGRCMHPSGNGKEIKQIINQLGIAKQCVLFDDFIPLNTFYTYLSLSDYVLPLIHPEKSQTKGYGNHKVSGAFNLAFGFKKIMFCDEYYARYHTFFDTSIFYNPDRMESIFEKLTNERIDKTSFYQSDFFVLMEKTQQNFLDFLKIKIV